MNEHDIKLLQWAGSQRWEDLNENMAETAQGKDMLHLLIMRKYHNDEYTGNIL